jgi:glycosyltransferase involved in cell wall biosynthesis
VHVCSVTDARHLQNEQVNIRLAIGSTHVPSATVQPQVIVADGGSSDCTVAEASHCGGANVLVLAVEGGRGAQLNAAADEAAGQWLLFLHADCTLPKNYFGELAAATTHRKLTPWQRLWREQCEPRWGCFETFQTGCARMAAVQWGVKQRTRIFGTPYGDQGLFCWKDTFHKVRLVQS